MCVYYSDKTKLLVFKTKRRTRMLRDVVRACDLTLRDFAPAKHSASLDHDNDEYRAPPAGIRQAKATLKISTTN